MGVPPLFRLHAPHLAHARQGAGRDGGDSVGGWMGRAWAGEGSDRKEGHFG